MKDNRYVKNQPADTETYKEIVFEEDKSFKARQERLKKNWQKREEFPIRP